MPRLRTYFIVFAILQATNPIFTHYLYDVSKDHIEWIDKNIRCPALTWYMHFCSVYGDGGEFPTLYVIIGALNINKGSFNSLYLMNYFMHTTIMGAYMTFALKPLFIASRPFFDDVKYADMGIKDCSAEFGNPSAHSLLATQTIPILLWQFQEVFRDLMKRNRCLKYSSDLVMYTFMVSICYSRVYVGRHSFD